ncbi:hypothetical protein SAMN04488074_12921 [Lentzea albidocapillata subsp. violacea]|uniref:Uncharacterized protein n=1 Tax=Lentzea albidocapillata subsp. violacea TaxID=128104 RepID=A0A1G9X2L7_9PSEU|nr:hypothetical protein SAMN04488074_12921 [Lentzea albidocapillata subsp. violacea]
MFSVTSDEPGTEPVPDWSQLVRWVRHTHVSACSFWPTPKAKDAVRGGMTEEAIYRSMATSRTAVDLGDAVGGPPNPTWIEWLMGFPTGWTDVAHSETPSSPPSQSTSAD